ncbi:MarR family transcriptional regulator [Streptomyces sp. ISL-100]|uniref:MarR family transcriptional regulator n=1 Tax=Streptomyces sp. ISL-100 TaxID=2819173 RepID=UPI001BEBD3F0|nr:MarR family transcriptional regulator [Streptomyces sp. ISL-100]MBT2400261.1 MarR family transcriptional regulator [Streptomyces sp. ISL-100]
MTLSDAELAQQPIAYWTDVAHKEILAFIRRELAELGMSQPQYWTLRHLSVNDLSEDGEGRTVEELTEAMRDYLAPQDDLVPDTEDLVVRGWLTRDATTGRLTITEAGEAGRRRVKDHVPAVRAKIHDGINARDYVTTIKVLRRMMRNVGGAGRAE